MKFIRQKWAVDFDHFLYKSKGREIDLETPPNNFVKILINNAKHFGADVYIHTSRPHEEKSKIEEYIKKYGLTVKGVITGKFIANKYFGDNYYSSPKDFLDPYSGGDEQGMNKVNFTLHNDREEIYSILYGMHRSFNYALLAQSVLQIFEKSADNKMAVFMAGDDIFENNARFLSDSIFKEFLLGSGRKKLFPYCLGTKANLTMVKNKEDVLRTDLLSVLASYMSMKKILIVFTKTAEDKVIRNLILETSHLSGINVYIFLSKDYLYRVNHKYNFSNVYFIPIDTNDSFILQSIYFTLSNSLIKFIKSNIKN